MVTNQEVLDEPLANRTPTTKVSGGGLYPAARSTAGLGIFL
ncbi:MAG: hypothetical protein AB1797_08295 [bacterium]